MRSIKTLFNLAVCCAVTFSAGCAKKSNPTAVPPAADNTNQTRANDVKTNVTGMLDFIGDFSGSLGGFMPSSAKGTKTPPDTCWHGPTDHSNHYNNPATGGWYSCNLSGLYGPAATIWVKFIDDIWANPSANVTRVDWSTDMTMTSGGGTATAKYSAYAGYGADTLHYNGAYWIDVTGGGTTSAFEFTWTNISRYGWEAGVRTCTGTFAYTGTGGISGNFTFANGSGTGSASYNGTALADFVFNSDGTGYYTVAGSTTQYQFNW
jgi:hypothetical protein